jgi:hypothetical protein
VDELEESLGEFDETAEQAEPDDDVDEDVRPEDEY